MPDYGYLHRGEIVRYDATTNSYYLRSVSLARTQLWGPVASCVPGLVKGDRVILGASGTSRDDLIILGKIGAEGLDIGDVAGLLDALGDKASAVDLQSVADQLDALSASEDMRYDGLATRLDVAEATLGTLTTGLAAANSSITALAATVAANRRVSGGGWYVAEDYQCPGTALQECDRMPFAGQLWKVGTDITLGPDNKHWICNKAGIWRPSFAPRWTTPNRPAPTAGTAGEGTDRSFHIGVTSRAFGPSNCTFESGISGWTISAAAGAIASSTVQKHSGTQSLRITPSGTSINVGALADNIAVVPGEKVTATTWVWFTTAVTGNYSSAINWFDASGTYLTTSLNAISVPAAVWTPVIQTYTAPAGAFFASLVPLLGGTPAASNVFYVDDVSIGPSFLDSSMFLFEENWNEVNTGNQHNQTKKLGSDLLLAVGDRLCLYSYWGGATTDRLTFPASSNRMSLTYVGPVS
jgi:hypothetical protein